MAARKPNGPKTEPNADKVLDPGLISIKGRLIGADRSDETDAEGTDDSELTGVPSAADMVLINQLSRTGNLNPQSLYTFGCVPSNQNVDSHFTFMDITSLKNYAAEANLGTPFMNSHRTGGWSSDAELPLGRSFKGLVKNDPEHEGLKLFSSYAYMVRNNRASNGTVNTDDIIAGMDAGTISDVSIQFRLLPGTAEKNFEDRSWLRCSICGNDFLRSDPWGDDPDDCPHWPGEVYKSDGGKKRELCTLAVVNAHLAEFSAVWSGSTPDAIVSKAQRAAQAGQFTRSMLYQLEGLYRCRLADHATFQVPIIGQQQDQRTRKAKPDEPVSTDPADRQEPVQPLEPTDPAETTDRKATTPTDPAVTPLNTERTEEIKMADKVEIERAEEKGAQIVLTEMIRSILDGGGVDEDGLTVLEQARTCIASGDTTRANQLIIGLLLGIRVDAADQPGGEPADQAGEGAGNDEPTDQRGEPVVSIVSLELTANQRQHYKQTVEENARLKKENKRLVQLAQLGERRFSEVIEETILAYNYAGMGDGEEIRETLVRMPYEQILNMRDQYVAIGHQKLSNLNEAGQPTFQGGRQTIPADANSPAFGKQTILTLPSRSIDPELYNSQGAGRVRR